MDASLFCGSAFVREACCGMPQKKRQGYILSKGRWAACVCKEDIRDLHREKQRLSIG